MRQRRAKGQGTVVEMGGRFYPRWTVAGKSVYGNPHDCWEDADAERINKRPGDGVALKPKSEIPTIQQFAIEQLQGQYGRALAPSTYDTNETIRVKHIAGTTFGKIRIDKLSRLQVIDWVSTIEGSSAWVRRVVAAVSKLFSLAVDQQLRADNPFLRLGAYLPKVEERQNRVLSREEAAKLASLDPERRTDAIIQFALYTGLRRGEILRLQWGHIEGQVLRVPGTKNKSSRRIISLSPATRTLLESQPRRSVFIFTTESGKPINPRNLTRDYKNRKEQLGIPDGARLHDMRGTMASLVLQEGVDLRTVMEITLDAKSSTLMELYARSNTGTKEAAAITLEKALKPKKSRKKKAEEA